MISLAAPLCVARQLLAHFFSRNEVVGRPFGATRIVKVDAWTSLCFVGPSYSTDQNAAPEGIGAALERSGLIDRATSSRAVEDAVEVGALAQTGATAETPEITAA